MKKNKNKKKKGDEMKYLLFVISVILIVLPTSAMSEDGISFFMDQCTANATNSQNFCECALKAYSQKVMEKENSFLKSMDPKIAATEKRILTLDPAMTKSKIDEVYALYVSQYEFQILAGPSRGEEKKKYSAKIDSLIQERKDLIKRFTDSPFTINLLTKDKYYANRYGATQIKKDIAEYDGVVYGSVRRALEIKSSFQYSRALSFGKRNNCPQ